MSGRADRCFCFGTPTPRLARSWMKSRSGRRGSSRWPLDVESRSNPYSSTIADTRSYRVREWRTQKHWRVLQSAIAYPEVADEPARSCHVHVNPVGGRRIWFADHHSDHTSCRSLPHSAVSALCVCLLCRSCCPSLGNKLLIPQVHRLKGRQNVSLLPGNVSPCWSSLPPSLPS